MHFKGIEFTPTLPHSSCAVYKIAQQNYVVGCTNGQIKFTPILTTIVLYVK